jgi:hypothetical protein
VPELAFNADPVPGTPIGDLLDWQLHIRCARCRQHTVLRLDYLAEQHGGRMRVMNVILRLRCGGFRGEGKCRGRPKLVTLVKVATYGKSTRMLRRITVLDTSNPWSLRPPEMSRPP